MNELKILIDALAELPDLAIWAVVLFFIYKVFIAGSIISLLALVAKRLFDWLSVRKNPPPFFETVKFRDQVRKITISDHSDLLLRQLKRIQGKRSYSSNYIHEGDIDWLKEAIDEKLEKGKGES